MSEVSPCSGLIRISGPPGSIPRPSALPYAYMGLSYRLEEGYGGLGWFREVEWDGFMG